MTSILIAIRGDRDKTGQIIFNIEIIDVVSRGESAALNDFSVSVFFGQVDNKESKNKYGSTAV